jgi:putative restriction endonuclease
MDPERDMRARLAAFQFLDRELARRGGPTLPFALLRAGFEHEGRRIHLMSQQGIFAPSGFAIPISIATAPRKPGKARPYDDAILGDGRLRYRYRGVDPSHRDNRGLRAAMEQRVPLVYFHGIVQGEYVPVFPVFVIQEHRDDHAFLIQADEIASVLQPMSTHERVDLNEGKERRRYQTCLVLRRLHQADFRERVLHAYGALCAVCRLKRATLLDAAHIRADCDGGDPVVPNGIAMCKLHHAAFDQHLIGIEPQSLVIKVRPEILSEEDGPMLRHGLQGVANTRLTLPRRRAHYPDAAALEYRYALYRRAL